MRIVIKFKEISSNSKVKRYKNKIKEYLICKSEFAKAFEKGMLKSQRECAEFFYSEDGNVFLEALDITANVFTAAFLEFFTFELSLNDFGDLIAIKCIKSSNDNFKFINDFLRNSFPEMKTKLTLKHKTSNTPVIVKTQIQGGPNNYITISFSNKFYNQNQ